MKFYVDMALQPLGVREQKKDGSSRRVLGIASLIRRYGTQKAPNVCT
jgi:hypothetical protein